MNEFELKFQVPDERVDEVDAAMRRGKVQRQRLQATYFDTPGEALVAAGLVLRMRKERGGWVQAVKGRGAHAFDRLEHEVSVAGSQAPAPDLGLHDGTPAGERLRDALRAEGASALRAVFATDVTRLSRTVEAGGSVVEIAYDRGQVRAGQR